MGRDKALLPYRGATLLEHVAHIVEEAVTPGAVAIVGDPARYGNAGYPVHPDQVASCGPLGGVYTALNLSATDWNLVVACDMPNLSAASLRALLEQASRSRANCVLATGSSGEPEPLCGVYHRLCLPVLDRAIRDNRFKMKDLVPELGAELVALPSDVLANVNTPAEWSEVQGQPG
ncbi:MAG: molybdenum cofactor guanylyltransferase [Acidobacteriia bacterium]|nr:molybdenum cofactor guanylyltransferase [Terriglobia bacterium]